MARTHRQKSMLSLSLKTFHYVSLYFSEYILQWKYVSLEGTQIKDCQKAVKVFQACGTIALVSQTKAGLVIQNLFPLSLTLPIKYTSHWESFLLGTKKGL